MKSFKEYLEDVDIALAYKITVSGFEPFYIDEKEFDSMTVSQFLSTIETKTVQKLTTSGVELAYKVLLKNKIKVIEKAEFSREETKDNTGKKIFKLKVNKEALKK
jgi:hypothetical protein